MMKVDRYALECDLAETYHIFDIYELPLRKVALFSYGLRDNSRIKLKMNEMNYSFETILLAGITDKLSYLLWSRSDDAAKGINKPDSILSKLLGVESGNQKDHITFNTGEDFEKMRIEILNKEKR